MRQSILLILLMVFTLPLVAQRAELWDNFNTSHAAQLVCTDSDQAAEFAREDLKNGVVILHLWSGYASINYDGDSAFQDQYSTIYLEHGCIAPVEEFMVSYNQQVFFYLDAEYGVSWRKAIRPDVLGTEETG